MYLHTRSSFLLSVFLVALFLAVGIFFGAYLFFTPQAQALYTCNAYQSFHAVPSGYGAAFDVFQTNKEVLLNADCGLDDFRINIGHAGHTSSNFAVYKTGYRWTGSAWQAITYTPDGGFLSGDYILGKAKSSGGAIDYASGNNSFFVAFTCSKQAGVWKCGCSDSTCAAHKWQLQAAAKGGSTINTNNTISPTNNTNNNNTNDTNAGGGTAAGSLEGMRLVAQHTFSEADLGKELTPSIMFGQYGIFTRTVNPATANYRTIGRAPDGRIAIQENVPRGTVPETTSMSHHFGAGATRAGFALDVWLPADFQFPGASSVCARPGQGRFPWGLWAGLPTKTSQPSGGGQTIASQDSISFRVNRSGGTGGQHAYMSTYLYNLNRYTPVCTASNVCSIAGCSSLNQECYGSGGHDSDVTAPRGRWFTVEATMSMNTPGNKDGCATLKVDGRQVFSRCGYDFGRDKGWLMQGYYGYGMWHCNGSPKDQKFWYSNLRMYSN